MLVALSLVPMTIFIMFSKSDTLNEFKSKLFYEGNIPARLDYWQNGIDIFRDNAFFGVGPDQFQKYAGLYRDTNQVLRDGAFVIPDKAHNTMIDQFANGGIFIGILWCLVVLIISVQPLLALRHEINLKNRFQIALLSAIWFSYIFQALISPDQVQLSVLGFATGALLLRECRIIRSPIHNVKIDRNT